MSPEKELKGMVQSMRTREVDGGHQRHRVLILEPVVAEEQEDAELRREEQSYPSADRSWLFLMNTK